MEVLGVGVDRDEFNPFDFGSYHMVNGIGAGAADTNDFYSRERFYIWLNSRHNIFSYTLRIKKQKADVKPLLRTQNFLTKGVNLALRQERFKPF